MVANPRDSGLSIVVAHCHELERRPVQSRPVTRKEREMTEAKLNPGERFVQLAAMPQTQWHHCVLYALTSEGRVMWLMHGDAGWTEVPLPPTEDSK